MQKKPDGGKKTKVEGIAHAIVITLCLIAVGAHWMNVPPAPVAVGDRIEQLGEVVPSGKGQAFLLVVSPTCPYCKDSLPSFKRLVEERDARDSPVGIVGAVSRAADLDLEQQIFEEGGVLVDEMVLLGTDDLRLRGVPTVLLVDKKGAVRAVWDGLVTEEKLRELLARL